MWLSKEPERTKAGRGKWRGKDKDSGMGDMVQSGSK